MQQIKWKDTSLILHDVTNMEKSQITWPAAKFYFEATFSL